MQGESIRIRRVDEVQEADQCSAIWFEPDSQPSFHLMVVAYHQQSERVCRFPGKNNNQPSRILILITL